jgi:hypothetical protein
MTTTIAKDVLKHALNAPKFAAKWRLNHTEKSLYNFFVQAFLYGELVEMIISKRAWIFVDIAA